MDYQDDSDKMVKVKSKDGRIYEASMQQLKMCGK